MGLVLIMSEVSAKDQHSTTASDAKPITSDSAANANPAPTTDMSNVLKHIKDLEVDRAKLKEELEELKQRNGRLSQKTREGMQSALDTLMKKWMDSCETKDEKVKADFKCGLEQLVKNSAEDNGVWQMMVSASALHERQEHNLEKLRVENNELRTRVNGYYGSESSRVVGEKSKPDEQLSRSDVAPDQTEWGNDAWSVFARDIGSSY